MEKGPNMGKWMGVVRGKEDAGDYEGRGRKREERRVVREGVQRVREVLRRV